MSDGHRFIGIPAYTVNDKGDHGILRRECTSHYKTRPIYTYLRQRLGVKPGHRGSQDNPSGILVGD